MMVMGYADVVDMRIDRQRFSGTAAGWMTLWETWDLLVKYQQ